MAGAGTGTASGPELDTATFDEVRDMLYRLCGIHMDEGKLGLVRSRLAKQVRARGLGGYAEYLAAVRSDPSGVELSEMIDVLTTNKTSFFREAEHFEYLVARVLPELRARSGAVRIWSAGCSSGEEPYTIAMTLRDAWPDIGARDVRILATDISSRVLERAQSGVYPASVTGGLPATILRRHFVREPGEREDSYRVVDSTRALVRFARLNLMAQWPMRGPFDAIFCRNVMIYFDRPTQERLVGRFWGALRAGGHLFIGHSESLNGMTHSFKYVQPAVYRR